MEDLKAEVKNALNNNDAATAAAKIQEYIKEQQNIPINIAITGEPGAGKSTFVNAFRGMKNDDEGAAPTGVTETTMEVAKYTHPKYPNVSLWDLPGIGTPSYPIDRYLRLVQYEKFDFFFLISADHFRENDLKLAHRILRRKKLLYFVRSKIDIALSAEEREGNFNEERTLKKLKADTVKGLRRRGFPSSRVFLVSGFELHLYDLPLLQGTLETELPALKIEALLSAMSNMNLEIINKRREAFQSKIKYYAALSAGVAGVPLPGLSAAVDLGLIGKLVKVYVAGFGLDKQSLERLAASTGVPFTDLLDVIRSPLAKEKITKELILRVLMSLTTTAALLAVEEGTKWIPVVGFVAAMGLSFMVTERVLIYILKELAEDAHRVFKTALGLSNSNE